MLEFYEEQNDFHLSVGISSCVDAYKKRQPVYMQNIQESKKLGNNSTTLFLLPQKMGNFDLTDSVPIDFSGVKVHHLNFYIYIIFYIAF